MPARMGLVLQGLDRILGSGEEGTSSPFGCVPNLVTIQKAFHVAFSTRV